MDKSDDALTLSNPRLLAAIYFSLLAIIVTFILDALFYALGVNPIINTFEGLLLATATAALFGTWFGKAIIHSKKPFKKKVFWLAFFMVVIALPVYDLGLLWLISTKPSHFFYNDSWYHSLQLYASLLFYSFVLVGIWLALLAGGAAIYLRAYLVHYFLQTLYSRRSPSKQQEIPIKHKTARHGATTVEKRKSTP